MMRKRFVAVFAGIIAITLLTALPAGATVAGRFGQTEVHGATLTWSGGRVDDASLMHIDLDDGTVVPVYCINNGLGISHHETQRYTEADWDAYSYTDFAKNSARIVWVLAHGYPNVSAADLAAASGASGLTEAEAITATQVAIWQLVDEKSAGVDYPGVGDRTAVGASSQRMQQVIDYYLDRATAAKEPSPTVSLTPTTVTDGHVRDRVGPFDVLTTADAVTVTATNGQVVAADGTAVTVAHNGDQIYLDTSDSEVGDATLTVSAPAATLDIGRIFVTEDGFPSQELVAATRSSVTAEAQAEIVLHEARAITAPTVTSTPSNPTVGSVPPPAAAPGSSADPAANPSLSTRSAGSGLASTGASTIVIGAIAAALIAAGAVAVRRSRSRRPVA